VHGIVENATQQNTHVSSYLKDDDDLFSDDVECLRPYISPLSANDPNSLQDYADALETHLFNPAVRLDMRGLAYTLSEKRTAHFHRSFLVAQGAGLSIGALHIGKLSPRPPRIGFIFTG
jgi:acyl transferase domain-containing protein